MPEATSFVMTVNAESPETLLESYVSFARQLKCPEYAVTNTHNSKDLNTDEKITNLKTLISTKIELYTSWLLVVDNVTNISGVHGHLPKRGSEQWARGQLLITTQDTASISLASSFHQHTSLSKGMEPRDAGSLLAMLSGIADSEMDQEVAQALDYQPLALASAATYVRQVRKNKPLKIPCHPTKFINHTFSFLSVCAPQPLRLDIVTNYVLDVQKEIEDKEAISMRILRCSLLLFEEEEKSGVHIRIHQVVHDAINTVIKDQHLQAVNGAVRSFSQFIAEYLSVDDLDSLVNRKHIVPHLKTLSMKIENLFSKQDISEVAQHRNVNIQCFPSNFQTLGKVCEDHSEFYAAKRYFNLALEIIQRSDAGNVRDVADVGLTLDKVHLNLSHFHQAKEHCQYPLAIQKKELGLEHAKIYHNLGNVHWELGDLEQAKECHDRALAIRLEKLGPEHVNVASTYNNLALVHWHLGDPEQAKEYYHRALTILLEKLGPEHVDVASTYNNLGVVHSDLGDLEQAKECHDRALAIRLEKLGPEHVDVASTYNNLGLVHKNLGDLEQAKEYYDRARVILLEKLGPEHVNVASTYNNLGLVHWHLGDREQQKTWVLYTRTWVTWSKQKSIMIVRGSFFWKSSDLSMLMSHRLTITWVLLTGTWVTGSKQKIIIIVHLLILLEKLGPERVDVASTYNNLGIVHMDLGDLEQAKECHDRALAIRLEKLGPEHVDVASTYNSLGLVHKDLGDLEQAKEYYDRARVILLEKLGPEHVNVASTYNNLGLAHWHLGDLEQAKEYHDRARAIRLEKLGPEHVDVASTYNNLGIVHRDLGDLEQAKECHDRALAIRLEKLGPEHVDVASTYNNLGIVHRDLGDLEQAKECHDRALAIRLEKLGPEHVDVASTYNNLGLVHKDLGDLEQAKECHDRALAIRLEKFGPEHV
ncbi:hypothetical protein OS493_026250 [Desmophyllum pertusum]|uniref:Kinesin light chain n=1 Tax=Desmophyllum pertusum TaxID=174260 RepID=A0A9W9ZLR5_9CNID|nr:hypothetical protein OS493_026250 [Desmophyllum pertusum]